jgi:hypothetical protein
VVASSKLLKGWMRPPGVKVQRPHTQPMTRPSANDVAAAADALSAVEKIKIGNATVELHP